MWFLLHALASPPLPLDRCVEAGRLSSLDARLLADALREGFGEPRRALGVVDRVVGAWPRCDAVWMARSGLLNTLGRREEALAALERAVDVALGPEATRALAVALHHAGDGGEVLQAAAARGDDALLALYAARERPLSERVDALMEAIERHPDDVALRIAAIQTLQEAGRPQEAVAKGRAWSERFPALRALTDEVDRPFVVDDTRRIQRPAEIRTLDDGTEEIVVYSPGRAKRALVERLEALGYTDGKPIDGGVRYRSERPVSPYVEIFDDGRVYVQESGAVKTAPLPDGSTMIPSISARKLRPDRIRVMEAINYETTVWQQALRLQRFQVELDEQLPVQLTALWEQGIPLYGEGRLGSRTARRDALVAHWSSRACSPDGDAARTVVERFLRNVVQDSDVALGPDEVRAIEAASPCPGRALRL
jgi:hypothetical protein